MEGTVQILIVMAAAVAAATAVMEENLEAVAAAMVAMEEMDASTMMMAVEVAVDTERMAMVGMLLNRAVLPLVVDVRAAAVPEFASSHISLKGDLQ